MQKFESTHQRSYDLLRCVSSNVWRKLSANKENRELTYHSHQSCPQNIIDLTLLCRKIIDLALFSRKIIDMTVYDRIIIYIALSYFKHAILFQLETPIPQFQVRNYEITGTQFLLIFWPSSQYTKLKEISQIP